MKQKRGNEIYKLKLCKNGRPHIQKECLFCGVKFLSSRSTAKYCSETCRVKHHRQNYIVKIHFNI